MSSIDLTLIAPPSVVDVPEFEALFVQRKADLLAIVPDALRPTIAATIELESEPLTIALQADCYRELLFRQRVNEAVRATFLASAIGADLDQFAAGRGIVRKVIQAGDDTVTPPVEEILESDAALRLRCQLFPEKLAAAGPRAAYFAHALDASPQVADAQVINADSGLVAAGTVRVYIKSVDGAADSAVLDTVNDYLSADERHPLCDTVQVMSATAKAVTIAWQNEYETGPDKTVVFAQQQQAINELTAQYGGIGVSVSLSKIIGALDVVGVKKVLLAEPLDDVVCDYGEFPVYTLQATAP